MRGSEVTIVVVPRERFSFTQESLRSLLAHTAGRPLVYVDGRSPLATRRYLEAQAREHGFVHLRTERYLSPNEARNIGLRHVRTPYVVFVDNDVTVSSHWLDRLVACAEETGAAIVGPLYYIDVGGRVTVHMAGGDGRIEQEHGTRVCREIHHHVDVPAPAASAFGRTECELVEFHAMLVHTRLFERVGLLDERLLSVNEHLDLCLSARALGERVYCEPSSVVTYVPAMRLRWSDLPFFMLRWSERWNQATSRHFNQKWQLDGGHPKNQEVLAYGRFHRQRGLRLVRERNPRTPIARALRRIGTELERRINLAYTVGNA